MRCPISVIEGGSITIEASGSWPFVFVPVLCQGFGFSNGTGVTLENAEDFARFAGMSCQRACAASIFCCAAPLSPMARLPVVNCCHDLSEVEAGLAEALNAEPLRHAV